jgi:hypothetical protein
MILPWHSQHIEELLMVAEEFGIPDRVYLNAKDYADIRKFGRDTLDIINDQRILKTGLFAHLFGIGIYVSRQETPGIIRVVDRIGKTLTHWNSIVDIDPCPGEISDCRICLVAQVMVG